MMAFTTPLLAVLLLTDPTEAERVEVVRCSAGLEALDREDGVLANAREAEAIEIASDRCDFDRTDGVILFDGHASVRYSAGYTVNADRLYCFFVGSNEFDRVVCEGNVVLTNGMRVGRCACAEFRRRTGEVVLNGDEGSPARLAERGVDELAGRCIRIWVDTEQVEVVDSELKIERDGASGHGRSVLKKGERGR